MHHFNRVDKYFSDFHDYDIKHLHKSRNRRKNKNNKDITQLYSACQILLKDLFKNKIDRCDQQAK